MFDPSWPTKSNRERLPSRLESSIQRSVVTYARKHLILAIKIATHGPYGNVGYPDYIFCLSGKAPLFIEFKNPNGGDLSKVQRARIADMRSKGHFVEICASPEHGKYVIDRWRLHEK